MNRGFQQGLLRYALVGVAATASHYALLAALVEGAQCPAWLASGAGATLGAQVAFAGNRRFTFAHIGPWGPAWLRFQGTAVLGALLGMGIVAVGVGAGWHYLGAQALATGCALLLTYAINRVWTFSKPNPNVHPPQPHRP